jgi:hypothetical protein
MCRVKGIEDDLTKGLDPASRSQIEPLLARQWSLPGDHPLSRLHGRSLGPYRLFVLLGPKSSVGSRLFRLYLLDAHGALSQEHLALGLHNTGPFPAFNWLELIQYNHALTVGGRKTDLAAEGLDLSLFEALSELIPPGGHIMCEYDSPGQRDTERVLTLGYPAVSSPTGYLMFRAGCRSYRDWYISEGGREGPRKLQGFRPLDEGIAREKTALLRGEVTAFLARPRNASHGEWGALARKLGADVLQHLSR